MMSYQEVSSVIQGIPDDDDLIEVSKQIVELGTVGDQTMMRFLTLAKCIESIWEHERGSSLIPKNINVKYEHPELEALMIERIGSSELEKGMTRTELMLYVCKLSDEGTIKLEVPIYAQFDSSICRLLVKGKIFQDNRKHNEIVYITESQKAIIDEMH